MPPISGIAGAFGSGASIVVASVAMIKLSFCVAIVMLLQPYRNIQLLFIFKSLHSKYLATVIKNIVKTITVMSALSNMPYIFPIFFTTNKRKNQ
jgi:hypothetical protein